MRAKISREFLILFLIVILGLGLRLYKLSEVPSGFFSDEASIGYNAYSILNTGKDEYSIPFPIFFRAFGEYKNPVQIYLTVPFIFIFGLSEFSTRLPSVFFGIITIIFLYLLIKELFNKRIALLSAFIASTMPWLLHYNRTAFELNSYIAFFIISLYLFIKSIKHRTYFIPACVSLALSIYTYYPTILIIPMLLLGILFIYRKIFLSRKKYFFAGFAAFTIICIPMLSSFLTGQGTARFNAVSVFSAKLSFTGTVSRIIHNYLFQLSPTLLISGEPTFITRHFTGGLTPILPITLPFIFVGLAHTFLTIQKRSSQLLIYWFLIYPIAGAVTADTPFTSRSIIGAPLFAIFISLGVSTTIKHVGKFINTSLLTVFILSAILINLLFFAKFYFTQYPMYSSDYWGWQYGFKPIMEKYHKNNFDELLITHRFNSGEELLKFYNVAYKCTNCKIMHNPIEIDLNKKQLFALRKDDIDEANILYKDLKYDINNIIYLPNNQPELFIGSFHKKQ